MNNPTDLLAASAADAERLYRRRMALASVGELPPAADVRAEANALLAVVRLSDAIDGGAR